MAFRLSASGTGRPSGSEAVFCRFRFQRCFTIYPGFTRLFLSLSEYRMLLLAFAAPFVLQQKKKSCGKYSPGSPFPQERLMILPEIPWSGALQVSHSIPHASVNKQPTHFVALQESKTRNKSKRVGFSVYSSLPSVDSPVRLR